MKTPPRGLSSSCSGVWTSSNRSCYPYLSYKALTFKFFYHFITEWRDSTSSYFLSRVLQSISRFFFLSFTSLFLGNETFVLFCDEIVKRCPTFLLSRKYVTIRVSHMLVPGFLDRFLPKYYSGKNNRPKLL